MNEIWQRIYKFAGHYIITNYREMRKSFYFLLVVFVTLAGVSCNKTQSYTDMLNAQKKAINKLIDENDFEILSSFPEDSIFKENQFVKLDNGVYLNIISKGNNDRAVLYSTDIQTRFIARMFMDTDTGTVDLMGPHSNGTSPVEFKYGYYTAGLSDNYNNQFIGEGLAAGLPYVGDSAYVKLIVPFKMMTDIGSSYYYGTAFKSSGIPVYFAKVRYIFIK